MRGILLALASFAVHAQNCPPLDAQRQEADRLACRAAGGEWARFGVHDHLCGIYSCAERTRDGGKSCRNRADCEHRCVTDATAVIGAEAAGRCTAVKTSFGCFVHVDAGRIVGRVCID